MTEQAKTKKPAAPKKAAPKKAAAKSANAGKMIAVTQVRAAHKRTEDQQATLRGLGLKKLHATRELQDTPAVRGMIRKVAHLIRVEERG